VDSDYEKHFNERIARLEEWNENSDRSLEKSRQERAIAWRELDVKFSDVRDLLDPLVHAANVRARRLDDSESSQK